MFISTNKRSMHVKSNSPLWSRKTHVSETAENTLKGREHALFYSLLDVWNLGRVRGNRTLEISTKDGLSDKCKPNLLSQL